MIILCHIYGRFGDAVINTLYPLSLTHLFLLDLSKVQLIKWSMNAIRVGAMIASRNYIIALKTFTVEVH